MFGFKKQPKNVGSASGLTSLEQQTSAIKIAELEARVAGLERAVIELCYGIRAHIYRMDHNTMMLDKNMHNLAAMTLRPPKDLLGGGQEPN
jgi:hypothetical protein